MASAGASAGASAAGAAAAAAAAAQRLGGRDALLRLLAGLRLLRVVARRALGKAGGIEEAQHAVGRLGAVLHPMLDALGLEHDALRVVLRQDRIPGADDLDEAAVAREARVGDDDAIERALLGAGAGETDFQGHRFSSFVRVRVKRFISFSAVRAGRGIPRRRDREVSSRREAREIQVAGRREDGPRRASGELLERGRVHRRHAAAAHAGMPIMPPMRANMPLPRPMAFIMSAIWRCILRSLLTSSTFVPEPAAMRFLRDRLEDVRVLALGFGHRRDDRRLAAEDGIVDAHRVDLLLHLADAGQHAHDARHAADLRHLLQLLGEIVEVEDALAHPLGGFRRLVRVDVLRRLLDQADDVAHAEDAAGDARRIEILERVELLAGAEELDRLAGDRAHRQRRAAAAVAVDAGQHDAGDADALVERLGEVDRVLAGERVGDEQDLVRAASPP